MEDLERSKAFKRNTQKAIQKAHTETFSGVLDKSMANKNPNPFWTNNKQQRKYSA